MGAPLFGGAARRINALWFPTHLLTTDRSAFILRQSYRKTRGEPMARKKKTDMLQGMLDLLILRSLRGGPLNGWDIMQRIQLARPPHPPAHGGEPAHRAPRRRARPAGRPRADRFLHRVAEHAQPPAVRPPGD